MVSIHLTYEGFNEDTAALEAEGGRIIRRVGERITRLTANEARARVPVKTGNLGRAISDDGGGFIAPLHWKGGDSANTHYAVFVHEGTRAHGPVRARFLRFEIDGKVIFAKRVRGVSARPFLRNALEAAAAEVVG